MTDQKRSWAADDTPLFLKIRTAAVGVGLSSLLGLNRQRGKSASTRRSDGRTTGGGSRRNQLRSPGLCAMMRLLTLGRPDCGRIRDRIPTSRSNGSPAVRTRARSGSPRTQSGTPPDVFSSWQDGGYGDYAARKLMLIRNCFCGEELSDPDLSTIPQALSKTYERWGLAGHSFASGASTSFLTKRRSMAGVAYPAQRIWDDPKWTWDAADTAKQLTKSYGNPDAHMVATSGYGRPTPPNGCLMPISIHKRPTTRA